MTISGLRDSIQTSFESYENVRNNLLIQLNRIFFGGTYDDIDGCPVKPDAEGHISLADFIKQTEEDKGVIRDFEAAEAKLAEAEAELAAAEARLEKAEAKLQVAEAELEKAEAELLVAEMALSFAQAMGMPSKIAEATSVKESAEEARDAALKARDAALKERNAANRARDTANRVRNTVNRVRDKAKPARDAALKKGFVSFSDCDESTAAYKFYARQIIDEINKLTDYINEAQKLLNKWGTLSGRNLSSQVRVDVVRLECLEQFCREIHQKFGTRYYYDFDEDNWKLAEDDYSGDESNTQITGSYTSYDRLYGVEVKCDAKGAAQKTLDCFNELNLLDRLKYIKVYFDIKETGTTNYVFPGSKEYGFPCVGEKDMDQTDVRIANLEKFYLGYLIDRDGPINAFCSLNEVKVRALQESLKELQKHIEALNVYLELINRSMQLLNQSQNAGQQRIPNACAIALVYLCGQDMYDLFECDKGKYLVLPGATEDNKNKYILIRADASGENFLLGDSADGNNGWWGNGYLCAHGDSHGHDFNDHIGLNYTDNIHLPCEQETSTHQVCCPQWKEEPTLGYFSPGIPKGANFYSGDSEALGVKFKLPNKLEVATINPGSVYHYTVFNGSCDDATIASWTDAFNKKTGYINTAIDTVNTDIEQIRNKMNTYQSQATTFRNRAHEVYANTVRRMKA